MLREYKRGVERFKAITDVYWETMQEPASMALIEIMIGSRSDPELAEQFPDIMADIEEKLRSGIREVATDIGVTDMKKVEAMAQLHGAAMRGLTIDRLFAKNQSAIGEAFNLLTWYKNMLTERLLPKEG
jgi:hypothetical protein